MPGPERFPRRLAAGTLLGAAAILAALPGYLVLSGTWRAAAIRLVGTAIVAAGGLHVLRVARRDASAAGPSALDAAPAASSRPILDAHFERLRGDLMWSARSRRYFDVVLWPRLSALAGGLAPPPRRVILPRLGPGWASLERIIAGIERLR